MKKEYIAVAVLGLFVLGYVLDSVAGPVNLVLKSPFEFVNADVLSRVPFTAVSIVIKTIALFSGILLIFSFLQKKLLLKGVIIFFIAALFELYTIQQLAGGLTLIPIQWTLTLAATGLLLVVPAIIFFILGLFYLIIDKTLKSGDDEEDA